MALSQIHLLRACCQRSEAEQGTNSKLFFQHANNNLADTSQHHKLESKLKAAALEALKHPLTLQTAGATSLSILHDALPILHAFTAHCQCEVQQGQLHLRPEK
jgi:hypothetical protein